MSGCIIFVAGCSPQPKEVVEASEEVILTSSKNTNVNEMVVESTSVEATVESRFRFRLRHHTPNVVGFELISKGKTIDQGTIRYNGGLKQMVRDVAQGLAEAPAKFAPIKRENTMMRQLTISVQHGSLKQQWVLVGNYSDIEDFIEASPLSGNAFYSFCSVAAKSYRIVDRPGPAKAWTPAE